MWIEGTLTDERYTARPRIESENCKLCDKGTEGHDCPEWAKCDTCGAWYNFTCAGLAVEDKDLIEHWHCASCREKRARGINRGPVLEVEDSDDEQLDDEEAWEEEEEEEEGEGDGEEEDEHMELEEEDEEGEQEEEEEEEEDEVTRELGLGRSALRTIVVPPAAPPPPPQPKYHIRSSAARRQGAVTH
jgi:hypothetical protein